MITITVKSISVINKMTGPVFVINGNGEQVQLQLGDKVTPGQVIQADSYESVQLIPVDEVQEPTVASTSDSDLPDGVADEIAALQEALLAGVDPTTSEDFEASAAGVEASNNTGGSNSSSSIGGSSGISRTGEATISTAGYDTSGLVRSPISQPEDTDQLQANTAPILPSVSITAVNNALDSEVNNVIEGNDLIFSVTTENASGGTLTLELNEGSAIAGKDFSSDLEFSLDGGNTWLNYPDSGIQIGEQNTILVRVPTFDDAFQEVPEDLSLSVAVTTPAGTVSDTVDALIHDDTGEQALQPGTDASTEDSVLVSISGPSTVIEGEQTSPYTIRLSEPLSEGQSVTVTLSYSGSATFGSDFTGELQVTIEGPADSAEFTLNTLDDAVKEGLESLVVSISSVTDNQNAFENIEVAGESNEVITDIIDNDLEAEVTLSPDITEDDVINGQEALQDIPVKGQVVGDFQAGDEVYITVNGKEFIGELETDGSFVIDIPGSDLIADEDFVIDAEVVVTDENGNSMTINDSESYNVDTEINAQIKLDSQITFDDVINKTEANSTISVTGKVSGDFTAGDSVTLLINNKTFSGSVDSDGKFSIGVPGSDLVNDNNNEIEATFIATDEVGNTLTVQDTEGYKTKVNISAAIELDSNITSDDLISASEASSLIQVTGKAYGDFQVGNIVSLVVNNNTYKGVIQDLQGNFSIAVAGKDLVADQDSTIYASMVATDGVGNRVQVTDTESYGIDLSLNTAVTLDKNITSDDIVDSEEAAQNIMVSGTASGDFQPGDVVTLAINGNTYIGQVDESGRFQVAVLGSDLYADSDSTIKASLNATTQTGESVLVTDTESYSTVELNNTSLSIDENITSDDVISQIEANQDVPITGKVEGNFSEGDLVTLVVNGKEFTGPINADGRFSIEVPGADLVADVDQTVEAKLTTVDVLGNAVTVTDTESYSVDLTSNTVLQLDSEITADDVINASEAGQQIPVTGKASGDFQAGDMVTLTVNGKIFTGPVDVDGNFSINVPGADLAADSDATIEASLVATNAIGGSQTVTDTEGYSVDTDMTNSAITLDENITADDIINAVEAGQQIPVTGKASGDFQTGDTVTLMVNDKTFTGPVDAEGNFTINVPGADLATDPDTTIEASLAATDAAGNTATVTDTEDYSVNLSVNAAINLDTEITADDIINAAEQSQSIPVTGKASGDFQTGDIVTLTVNGKTFTGPVDVDGNFSINVPGSDLAADPDATIEASLVATNA
ncbi:retention module-containing protein, partial [Motilimonas pumila]